MFLSVLYVVDIDLTHTGQKADSKGDVITSALAKYPFTKDKKGDLSFKKGERLEVIKFLNDSWWLARNQTGETGQVPSNYLVKMSDGKFGTDHKEFISTQHTVYPKS